MGTWSLPKVFLKEVPGSCWPGKKSHPEGLCQAERVAPLPCGEPPASETLAKPGSPALAEGTGTLTPPQVTHLLRGVSSYDQETEVFAEMWVQTGDLSPCLSMCQVGSCAQGHPWCLIRGSVPSQLDEEEERRKRRREKNKVAAARCRNKKKERTEFLQRVSGVVVEGRHLGLCRAHVLRSRVHHQTPQPGEGRKIHVFPPLSLDPGY